MQEYEKRLLAKDQEVKAAQLAVRRLEAELLDAREAAAAAAHMLPAPEPKQGAQRVPRVLSRCSMIHCPLCACHPCSLGQSWK